MSCAMVAVKVRWMELVSLVILVLVHESLVVRKGSCTKESRIWVTRNTQWRALAIENRSKIF